jgi:chemotaxis protein CheZ
VLNQVDQAKEQHDFIAAETRRIGELIVKDPVAAVAKGHVMNFINDVDQASKKVDGHLTEIMMAQDFHDLTGQVIAKVVNLAATIEEQLVLLLLQTAPPEAAAKAAPPSEYVPALAGPVVDGQSNQEVVTDQSQVDDLLASLGF